MRLAAVLRPEPSGAIKVPDGANRNATRRRTERHSLRLSAVTTLPSAGGTQVLIRDISPGGILIEAEPAALTVDDWIEVSLPDTGPVKGRVAWTSGGFFGCEFYQPISVAALSAALLKARPASDADSFLDTMSDKPPLSGSRSRVLPELDFSVAMMLSFALWGLIWAAVYTIAG
jgi:hypothetical protein